MARADLIINQVKAGIRCDQAQFQKTVEALAADERAKNHDVLADRLISQLRNNGGPRSTVAPSTTCGFPNHLVAEVRPGRRIEDLVLPKETEKVVRDLVEEQHRADLLPMEDSGTDVLRRVVLSQPDLDIRKITGGCLEQWKKRFTPTNTELGEEES